MAKTVSDGYARRVQREKASEVHEGMINKMFYVGGGGSHSSSPFPLLLLSSSFSPQPFIPFLFLFLAALVDAILNRPRNLYPGHTLDRLSGNCEPSTLTVFPSGLFSPHNKSVYKHSQALMKRAVIFLKGYCDLGRYSYTLQLACTQDTSCFEDGS